MSRCLQLFESTDLDSRRWTELCSFHWGTTPPTQSHLFARHDLSWRSLQHVSPLGISYQRAYRTQTGGTQNKRTPVAYHALCVKILLLGSFCRGRVVCRRGSVNADVAGDQERPYHSDSTASRPLCEVKHCRARLVLRWGTTLESRVLFFCRNQQHYTLLGPFAVRAVLYHTAHKPHTTYPWPQQNQNQKEKSERQPQ